MSLTNQQEGGRKAIMDWWRTSEQLFRFQGAAGTGKTTLLKLIAQDLGVRVKFAAYTGKAASILRMKGCTDASTIHSLMFRPSGGSTAKLQLMIKELEELMKVKGSTSHAVEQLRKEIAAEEEAVAKPQFNLELGTLKESVDLLILDEVSMIDEYLEEDILSSGIRIIASGDPWQLKPVRGRQGIFNDRADYLLTEVHRQAKDSGILQLATIIREGGAIKPGYYGEDCLVVRRGGENNGALALGADQILCGRNATRRATSNTIRAARGIEAEMPQPGERLMCLGNDHRKGLLNGTMWNVERKGARSGPRLLQMAISPLDGVGLPTTVNCHVLPFLGQDIPAKDKRSMSQFDFGYAATVHKAQGSQWDSVFLMREHGQWDQQAHDYTGVTRAAKKLCVAI